MVVESKHFKCPLLYADFNTKKKFLKAYPDSHDKSQQDN